ncbi:sigma-70 family RNA polymerase sigma factor [Streptomyces sp. NPDC002018]|uniref:sigma-70 family RNA polymerase sigma factor n=1 Tax=Streptomyces sp. NPDC002018 TaxID=3364629 RepID=UPI003689948D
MTSQAGRNAAHPVQRQHHPVHALVEEHRGALLSYAERLLADRHLAEDIVQETLIRAWHHIDRLLEREGSVRGWLLTVARNLVIDRMRSAHSRHETVASDTRDVPQPDHTHAVLTSLETTSLLRGLSLEQREVLVHTYLCGRTVKETAHILGIPAGTVKSRQHYALHTLRRRVGEESVSDGHAAGAEHIGTRRPTAR